MTDPRMRMATIAGSMALSLSLALAPAAMAQDGPEATIQGFMDAVVAKDFEALPAFFCEAEAGQAAEFDLLARAGELPPGLDVQSLLDAFDFDVSLDSIDVLSQTQDEAVVHIVGSTSMQLDEEALVPFVEAIIEMAGMEVDEASVGMFMGIITGQFEMQPQAFDVEVTLVPGDPGWLICSDLDFSADEVMSDGDTTEAGTEGGDVAGEGEGE